MATTPLIVGTPYLVPLQPTPQTLTVSLGGVTYLLTVRWNNVNQAWTIDIADSGGNPILSGIPMVTGRDLLEPFGYLNFGGQLYAQTTNDTYAVPTFTNLGITGNLYFVVVEAEEVVTSAASSEGTPVTALQIAYNEIPAGVIDGVNTIFTLAHSPNPPNSLLLLWNNDPASATPAPDGRVDFTLVGNVITTTRAPMPANGNQPAEFLLAKSYTY